jgi:hypothetical protein
MFRRIVFIALAALLLLSIGVALAQDGGVIPVTTKDYGTISMINDGRLNGADVGAPVAVYYKYDTVRTPGDWKATFYEQKVLRGLELLAIDPKTNEGNLVLSVPLKTMIEAIDKSGHREGLVVAEQNGYALHYSKANWFWISTPADKEGKVYTFKWQNFTVEHD